MLLTIKSDQKSSINFYFKDYSVQEDIDNKIRKIEQDKKQQASKILVLRSKYA